MEIIQEKLSRILSPIRYRHSQGTCEVAKDLAVIYGVNEDKAGKAGILHDCARFLSDEELIMECRKKHLPISKIELECPFLLHAKLGAYYAGKIYGVKDTDVLDAITYHTTGRPGMTLLEKIIFVADYIEPYRKNKTAINEIRLVAYNELDKAVFMILENNIKYLKTNNLVIDERTIETYQYMAQAK